MINARWNFPLSGHGEEHGINDSTSWFRGDPLRSLAREIGQNSLDAADGSDQPVVLEFELAKIPIPQCIKSLEPVFEKCKDYWSDQNDKKTSRFFAHAIEKLHDEKIGVMRISDYHTTGLRGANKARHSEWTGLIKSLGVSDKKSSSGGSFGLGKSAPFVCSDFHTIFYSTLDVDGTRAYQGVARLVSFEDKKHDDITQGVGYFGNPEKNTPVIGKQLDLLPNAVRKPGQEGTDVYIMGYRTMESDWQKEIIRSILDSFLYSIWAGKLVVKVGEKLIDKESLPRLMKEFRDDLKTGEYSTSFVNEFYEVLCSDKAVKWDDFDDGKGKVILTLLPYKGSDSLKRVAMVRKNGMKIYAEKKLQSVLGYCGILYVADDELNARFRAMEGPEHKFWNYKMDEDNPKEAHRLLLRLRRWMQAKMDSLNPNKDAKKIEAFGTGQYLPVYEDSDNQDAGESLQVKETNVSVKHIDPIHANGGISTDQGTSSEPDEQGDENILIDNGDSGMQGNGNENGTGSGDSGTGTGTGEGQRGGGDGGRGAGDNGRDPGQGRKMIPVPFHQRMMCPDSRSGLYRLSITPERDVAEGEIELFLQAETRSYSAPLLEAKFNQKPVKVVENKICGISMKAGEHAIIDVKLDYHDICSMGVKLHATEK